MPFTFPSDALDAHAAQDERRARVPDADDLVAEREGLLDLVVGLRCRVVEYPELVVDAQEDLPRLTRERLHDVDVAVRHAGGECLLLDLLLGLLVRDLLDLLQMLLHLLLDLLCLLVLLLALLLLAVLLLPVLLLALLHLLAEGLLLLLPAELLEQLLVRLLLAELLELLLELLDELLLALTTLALTAHARLLLTVRLLAHAVLLLLVGRGARELLTLLAHLGVMLMRVPPSINGWLRCLSARDDQADDLVVREPHTYVGPSPCEGGVHRLAGLGGRIVQIAPGARHEQA